MKLSVRARALVIGLAAGSLLAVPLAVPASAATGASCKKVSYSAKTSKFAVAQCTPVAATGGSGSGPVSGTKPGQTSGTLNVKVTWAQHKGTTSAKITFKPTTPGKCPVGTTRLKISGSVTGGTGTAVKTIKKGQPVSGFVCLNTKTTAVTIEPGTSVKF